MEYIIGLIDEEDAQLSTIRRTIKTHLDGKEYRIAFKEYPLSGGADTLATNVTKEVIDDIFSDAINSLIIDYKIMIKTALVEGTDIYKKILERVPRFPVTILTDVPDNCYKKDFVDADKVYWKHDFFKIEGDYSKEKTRNMFFNMDRYIKQRAEMSLRLRELLDRLGTDGFSPDLYQEIISIEKNLDELYPLGQTQIDKAIKMNELKEAVALLLEAERIVRNLP